MDRPFCILTQDLATRTGYAWWKPGMPRPEWGHVDLPKTGEEIGRVLRSYRRWFFKLANKIQPTVVVMEAPALFNSARGDGRTDNRNMARRLLGLANECETNTLCLEIDGQPAYADPREIGHATMMVHWVGSGRLNHVDGKAYSIKAAAVKGWKVACDDEADALGLLDHFVYTHGKTLGLEIPWDCRPSPRPDWLDLKAAGRVIAG